MTVLLEFLSRACYQGKVSFTKGLLTMKRINSHTAANRLENRLVLNRETLRRLGADELEQVVGATVFASCTCTTVTTQQPNNGDR